MANFRCGLVDIGVYGPDDNKKYTVKCWAPGKVPYEVEVPVPPPALPEGYTAERWAARTGVVAAICADTDIADAAACGIANGDYQVQPA